MKLTRQTDGSIGVTASIPEHLRTAFHNLPLGAQRFLRSQGKHRDYRAVWNAHHGIFELPIVEWELIDRDRQSKAWSRPRDANAQFAKAPRPQA
jgi:hypothetical protein